MTQALQLTGLFIGVVILVAALTYDWAAHFELKRLCREDGDDWTLRDALRGVRGGP